MAVTEKWWLSTPGFTVQIDTRDRIITAAPPLLKKFLGQQFSALLRWVLKTQGRFHHERIGYERDIKEKTPEEEKEAIMIPERHTHGKRLQQGQNRDARVQAGQPAFREQDRPGGQVERTSRRDSIERTTQGEEVTEAAQPGDKAVSRLRPVSTGARAAIDSQLSFFETPQTQQTQEITLRTGKAETHNEVSYATNQTLFAKNGEESESKDRDRQKQQEQKVVVKPNRKAAALRARLAPPGTRLADLRPDFEGLTLQEWKELRWLDTVAAAAGSGFHREKSQ